MAIRNYITLDGKQYKTPAKTWEPTPTRPATVRRTLLGRGDATFGANSWREWRGEVEGPVTSPGALWGTLGDLRASLVKRQVLAFEDHYGNSCSVVALGPFAERSIMNVWDDPENSIFLTVALVEA
jgi:hypothetical protein